jgi:glycerate kinase
LPATPLPPVLVSPDAFTGTLRASEVAAAIGRGLERAGLVPPTLGPVAGGGAGTLEVLLTALGGETAGAAAHDALGRPIPAGFALIEDGGTAIVEVAEASGLQRLAPEQRDAVTASTQGTGELLVAAAAAGAQVILVAAGGNDADDGGAGAIEAIDAAGGLHGARLVVLSETRATTGMAGALHARYGAQVEPGAPFVLKAIGFDERLRAARAVIVGEGRLDATTLEGLVAGEIATRARQAGVPCHAIVGANAIDRFGARILDLQVILEAGTREELAAAGERLGRMLDAREA